MERLALGKDTMRLMRRSPRSSGPRALPVDEDVQSMNGHPARNALWGTSLALPIMVACAILVWSPRPARAIGCLQDGWDNGTLSGSTIFPNWYRFPNR